MVSKRVLALLMGICLVLMMLSLTSAISGKIGNARVVLYPEVGFFGTTIDRTILVINDETKNDAPINISLEADKNSSFIEIIDKNFILEPGQEKEARVKIKLEEPGDYIGKVNVFFSPIEGKGARVVLSSIFIIRAKSSGDNSGDDEGQDDEGNETITGNAVKLNEFAKKNAGLIIASLSTLILALALLFLYIINKKKGSEKVNKKKGNDRSG